MTCPAPAVRLLTLIGVAACLISCPGSPGNDDDSTLGGDDDDDDSASSNLISIAGLITYHHTDGEVPSGAVQVGLFRPTKSNPGPDDTVRESYTTQVSKPGLLEGESPYSFELTGPPPEGDIRQWDEDDWEEAYYLVAAYVDSDQSGGYSAVDVLLGSSPNLLAYVRPYGALSDRHVEAGLGEGWNIVSILYPSRDDFNGQHIPSGVESTDGPQIEVGLLPRHVGSIPLTTQLQLPGGLVVTARHSSLITGTEPPPDGGQLLTQIITEGNPSTALPDWQVTGPPPPSHLGAVDFFGVSLVSPPVIHEEDEEEQPWLPQSLQGALYRGAAFYDHDQDQVFGSVACDTLVAEAEALYLLWVDSASLTPVGGYFVQHLGLSVGWSLYNPKPRMSQPLSEGIRLGPLTAQSGDDDDSAEPSLGLIPPECLSAGDDDDSSTPG